MDSSHEVSDSGGVNEGKRECASREKELNVETTPVPVLIRSFLTGIRIGAGAERPDDEPLDAQEEKSLTDCHNMLAVVSSLVMLTKIILAAVAYKIAEEKLWRGQYASAIECVMELMRVQESTAYRYVASGGVIQAVAKKHDIATLPNSLDAFVPFAGLKDEEEILKLYDTARTKCKGGTLTKSVAQKTVDEFLRRNKPDKASCKLDESSVSVTQVGKDGKGIDNEPSDAGNPTSVGIREQLEALAKAKKLKCVDAESLIIGVTHIVEKYLNKRPEAKYRERLKVAAGQLYALFEGANAEAKS